ncbi:hypothetical protein [Olsenella uli]|uniref:hypothetical protein n=1 Tax=Olsenella uli TaxID=133926 RepID=UPI0024202114|nr:hypothetical protein [Olsenella uli]
MAETTDKHMETTSETEFERLVKEVGERDHIVIDDGEGNEYTIRYPRAVVRKMEADGVSLQTVTEDLSSGTLTGSERFVREFVLPGFKAEQPRMTFDNVLAIWEQLPDKGTLISYLSVLFSQGVRAISGNPTKESRMKFRLV